MARFGELPQPTDAQRQKMMGPFAGFRQTCFFCGAEWGKCSCKFTDSEDESAPGFEFSDSWIVSPNVSVCGRYYVDPEVYYGKAYTEWAAKEKI